MDSSICQISVNSKQGSFIKCKGNQATSTGNDSKVQLIDSLQQISSHNQNLSGNGEAIKGVQKKMREIQAAQKELASKFEKVIDNLIREINKKDELNVVLEIEVAELRNQLNESKKDLSIIAAYLKKKTLKTSEKIVGRPLLKGQKIDISVSGSKKSIDISSKQLRTDKKSKSPRGLLLQKRLNL